MKKRMLLPLFIVLMGGWVVSCYGQVFNDVTISESNSYEVSAIETPNHVFVAAWTEDRDGQPIQASAFDKQIAVSVSYDYGFTWSDKVIFDDVAYTMSGNPTLCSDENGTIYLLFMTPVFLQEGKLELYKSGDNGGSWVHLNVPVNEPDAMPDFPHLTVKNDTITIGYSEYSASFESSIRRVRSTNGGATWSAPAILSSADDNTCMASFMNRGSDGTVFISWAHSDHAKPVMLAASKNDGLNFGMPMVAAASNHDNFATHFVCSATSSKIGILYYVVHEFGLVYYVGSDDYGVTWHQPILVSMNGSMPSGDFDEKDYLHITYTENIASDSIACRYVYSKNNGITISAPVTIADKSLIMCLNRYIGANSSTFYGSDNTVHAFRIDWSNENSRLIHTFWDADYVSVKETDNAITMLVYPDPADDYTVFIGKPENDNQNLTVTDLTGRILIKQTFNPGTREIVADTSSLRDGLYIGTVTDGTNAVYSNRFIVLHR